MSWLRAIFQAPTHAQAIMLVLFLENLPRHLTPVRWMMFPGFCGTFWQIEHQFQRAILLFAHMIVAKMVECALEQKQMGRECVLSPQPGNLAAQRF